MSEPARKSPAICYDQDFHAWSEEQGRLLRAKSISELDWDNLAEEIETLGRSERSEIRSRLIILLLHLLKWQHQPTKRKPGWQASIMEARNGINEQLQASPSLRTYSARVLSKQYDVARLKAADETDLPVAHFPAQCPYLVAEILDEKFYPGEAS